jgi:hypothetical protein
MPLTPHGKRQLARLGRNYDPETAKRILYASRNLGKKGFANIDKSRRKKLRQKARGRKR